MPHYYVNKKNKLMAIMKFINQIALICQMKHGFIWVILSTALV